MKNAKKLLTLAISMMLVLCMLFSMTACSVSGSGETEKPAVEKPAETPAEKPAEEPSAETPAEEPPAETPAADGETVIGSNGLLQNAGGKLKIAYLLDSLTNDSSQRHWQQVQNECEMRGWELIYDNNVSGNYEADATRQAFQNMMAQEPDAIVISYLDIPPIADLCVEAHNKGIGVYCIGTDISEGIMMNVCSNNSVIGAKVMAYVMDRLGGEANVIGFQNLWMTRGIRRDEIAMAMADSKTYNVAATEVHEVTPEGFTDEMFSVTENWLTKHGNDIDFIWACWDGGGIVQAQAMAAAGYTADDMFTVGMDGGNQAWAYIRNGDIPFVASLAEPFEYQVHQCFEGIKELQVEGKFRGAADCIIPASGEYSTDNMTVMVDVNNCPAVGANIHSVFDFYGGDPEDPDAWYNQGTLYTVADFSE